MIVRVVKRSDCRWYVRIVTVEISDKCPTCGEKRGKPYGHNFCEDDEWYNCDKWDNPCGHIDYYPDVLKEAAELLKQKETVSLQKTTASD